MQKCCVLIFELLVAGAIACGITGLVTHFWVALYSGDVKTFHYGLLKWCETDNFCVSIWESVTNYTARTQASVETPAYYLKLRVVFWLIFAGICVYLITAICGVVAAFSHLDTRYKLYLAATILCYIAGNAILIGVALYDRTNNGMGEAIVELRKDMEYMFTSKYDVSFYLTVASGAAGIIAGGVAFALGWCAKRKRRENIRYVY